MRFTRTPVNRKYGKTIMRANPSLVALFKAAVPGLETIVLGKPQPALLRAAMARLGAAAHETVMIGDQVSTDIRAAEAAALQATPTSDMKGLLR